MRSFAILSLLVCAACSGQPRAPESPPPAQGDDKASPAATLAQLRTLVGNAPCGDDSQCRSLPLGAKPCGGPEGYLAWSSAHSPEREVLALGQRYQAERRAEAQQRGMVSDCRFQPDPGAACRAGSCQLDLSTPVAR
jgi:hypothetical protein